MNVQEIITLAQMKSEEVYDDPTWIGFINAGIDDLTPIAKLLKTVTLEAETLVSGYVEINIVADPANGLEEAHEVLSVYATVTDPVGGKRKQLRRLNMNDNISQGWKLTYDKLIIQHLGADVVEATIEVDIYKKPDHVEDMEDIPEFPAQYHTLLVLYICAKSQQKEEELNDKNDFYAEYIMGKNGMALDRIWETEPQNRKFIRKARIAARINMSTDK